jgi:short-subunit dehydrogenase
MSVLIVGGTSGLGLELARDFVEDGNEVVVTGRHNPEEEGVEYHQLNLSQAMAFEAIGKLVMQLPEIKTLVYAAGYFQEGTVTDLSLGKIREMNMVCYEGLVCFVKKILHKQEHLDELITVTSTSQFTPRQKEPIYTGAKAAAGMFSNSMAEDGRVGKVLVAAPAGMSTKFWEGTGRDTSKDNDPADVATEIMKAREGKFDYKFIKILRDPMTVEEVEKR